MIALGAAIALAVIAVFVSASIGNGGSSPSSGGDYLALGDSLAFGYQPTGERPRPDYRNVADFVGYPEDAARSLHLHLVNASCPGETVASMISSTSPSNGCENIDGTGGGYRTVYPLHAAYTGSQLAFAVRYLEGHSEVRLVTIDLGINDVAVCEQITADHCASLIERNALRAEIRSGLQRILRAIRYTAGYRGRLVAVTYYSTSAAEAATAHAVDDIVGSVTEQYGGGLADGYRAFSRASADDRGNACEAGLLIALPDGSCDQHPSSRGQMLLAGAVVGADKER